VRRSSNEEPSPTRAEPRTPNPERRTPNPERRTVPTAIIHAVMPMVAGSPTAAMNRAPMSC